MADAFKSLGNLDQLRRRILVIGVLYWAQAVLVPVCLAVLLTFVLTPPVKSLQRRIGRVPAILTTVILVFSSLGLAGYGVYRQMSSMSDELPTYRANIRAKIHDIRGVRSGGSVQKIEQTLQQIQGDLGAIEGTGGNGDAAAGRHECGHRLASRRSPGSDRWSSPSARRASW